MQGQLHKNVYIKSAVLNENSMDVSYLEHTVIENGGKLLLQMADLPNYNRGTTTSAYPYSMTKTQ